MSKKQAKGYDEAVKELNKILNELEGDDISIDKLSEKVNRAKELVEYCNERLRSIESEFEEEE